MLYKVQDKIISTDQADYMRKHFIGHHIRLLQDVIDYAEKHKSKVHYFSYILQKLSTV